MQTFQAEERSIREILGKKQVKYLIPRNQREYTWDEPQWNELWIDINDTIIFKKNTFEVNKYFIGSCLFQKEKTGFDLNVLDGQQRLTTFIIVLSVLYDIFKELEQDKLLDGLYSYISKTSDDGETFFILENDNISPFFEEQILFKGEGRISYKPQQQQEKKIQKCYDYFYTKLKNTSLNYEKQNIEYLKIFRDQLLELKIIEIVVTNEMDGYTIFEILNARGKQLELADRMKNLILKKLPRTFPSDQAKIHWDTIKNNIEKVSKVESSLSTFINHYWISTYQKATSDEDLYHYFKITVLQDNIEDFIKDLEEKSEIYLNIAKPNIEVLPNKEIFSSLLHLTYFRTTQVRPILLSLFHNYKQGKLSEKDLTKIITKIEHFHFIYSAICNEPTNKIEKLYHEYASIIRNQYNKANINNFFDQLLDKIPQYDEFEKNFINKALFSNKNKEYDKNKKLMNYMLKKFEKFYRNTDELEINNMTIEHIKGDKGNEITAMIGNLLPLAQKLNENAENFPLHEKIQYYEKSEFESVKMFLKHHSDKKQWTDTNIEERSKIMANLAYNKVWKM